MAGTARRCREVAPVTATAGAIDRFLASPALAESTRRAYAADLRGFAAWLERRGTALDEIDVRALVDYASELGRARNGLAPATIARKLASVRSFLRFTLGPTRVPDAALGAATAATAARSTEARGGRGDPRRASTATGRSALRNRALVELVYSAGLRSAEAVGLDLADVDFEQEHVRVRGKGGKERVVPLGEEAAHLAGPLPARGASGARAGRERRLLPLDPRPPARHEHAAPPASPPPPAPPLVRHPPARGRRRPAHDPGAARPLVALDDAGVQPCQRETSPQGL